MFRNSPRRSPSWSAIRAWGCPGRNRNGRVRNVPPLNTINILAQLKFASHQLKLGTKKAGKGAKEGHSDKYEKDRDKSNDPTVTPTVMPPMFTPQVAGNPYHLDSCNKIGQNWIDFMNSMLDAVKFAHRSEERRVGKECRSRWS